MENINDEKVILIGDINTRIAEKRGVELWNERKNKFETVIVEATK